MDINGYIDKYEAWVIGLILIALLVLLFFIAMVIVSWYKGNDVKFLWFEFKHNEKKVSMGGNKESVNAKNVNFGVNNGQIGDNYNGIQQRYLTDSDKSQLLNDLIVFRNEHSDEINHSHVTIGFPGDKESKNLANEVCRFLHSNGYTNIIPMILQTYGVTGRKIGVSNAPDNSILIEIFPADNV